MDKLLDQICERHMPDSYERAAQAVALAARLKDILDDLDCLHLSIPAAHVASAIDALEKSQF